MPPSSAAPTTVRVPGDLGERGLESTGISSDGWLAQDSSVVLAGGKAGVLTLRAQVPYARGQRLRVLVNGLQVAARALPAGPLTLQARIPASRTDRRIELRFADAVRLRPPDTRRAAALLSFVGVGVGAAPSAPRSLTFPGGLSRANVTASGLYPDGWAARRVEISLAGGGPADLTVRGQAPVSGQRLDLLVDGARLLSQPLQPGPFALHVPVPASRGDRSVELRFARAFRLSPPDTRTAAALVTYLGLAALHGQASLAIPADLGRAGVSSSGIYPDGWAEKDVQVVLVGGPPAGISITALTELKGQRVQVLVDGRTLATADVPPGSATLRVPVSGTSGPRVVELRFARTAPISANDPRRAAALLETIAVERVGAPATVQMPADLAKPTLAYSGIYADGWAQKDVRVLVAGGPAATLAITALTPFRDQRVQVLVDGRSLATKPLAVGPATVRVHVPASAQPRLLELRFAGALPIAKNDPRPAATLLRTIALVAATG